MSKHLKSVAFLVLAAVLVTAGYIETQQNLLGLNDDASMAFAALNADNQQTSPGRTTTFTNGGAGTGVATGTKANVQGTLGAITGWNLDANYGTAGTSTLEAIKEQFRTNLGTALPDNFTPIIAPAQITVTHGGGAGAIVPIPQPTVTSAQFAGTSPRQLSCMKYNGTSFITLPYVTANPGTTAPTTNSWALFDYNGGGAATPTFITLDSTAMTAATEVLLVLYIADNGPYDTNAGANFVQDPPALGVATAGLVGGSSGSGCVFNPAAGMSLEWLLLLLGPAVLMFRRKK